MDRIISKKKTTMRLSIETDNSFEAICHIMLFHLNRFG